MLYLFKGGLYYQKFTMWDVIPHYDINSFMCHNVTCNLYLSMNLTVNTYNAEEMNCQVTEFQLHKVALINDSVVNI